MMHTLFFSFYFIALMLFSSENSILDLSHLGWDHEKEFNEWAERFKPENLAKARDVLRHPLHLASANGRTGIVKYCIKNLDLNINLRSTIWSTPLMFAAQNNHLDVIRYLLNEGAVVNALNADNETALHFAVYRNHLEAVELLLQNKANVHFFNSALKTPLMIAAERELTKIAHILLKYGADVDIKSKQDQNSLLLHAKNAALIKILLRYSPKVDFYLVKVNKEAAKEQLLYGILYANDKKDSYPPVLESIITKEDSLQEFAQIAHENPKLLDEEDELGNTPLFYAATQGRVSTVKFLLNQRVRALVINSDGHTVSQYVNRITHKRLDLNDAERLNYNTIEKLLYCYTAGSQWALKQSEFICLPKDMLSELRRRL